jgi:glycerol-3-phosphate acyltransferase PlsY
MNALIAVMSAYLLGGIPFGYLLVKWLRGRDIRSEGSGNIGATNVLRTAGKGVGVTTLMLDVAKGYVAVKGTGLLTRDSVVWMSVAVLAVMLGHTFPVFLKFRGGKAVASCLGAFLCLAPVPLAAVVTVFVVTVGLSRYVSLGSILAAASLPVAVWIFSRPDWPVVLSAVSAAVLIIWRHKSNIERLRSGKEHVLSLGGRR